MCVRTACTPASALRVAAPASEGPVSVAEMAACHRPLMASAFCATASACVPATCDGRYARSGVKGFHAMSQTGRYSKSHACFATSQTG
eukprot:6208841-Pyramimonas_sp.AAC.1